MTAYELRISDWSSDVCSSDLQHLQADVQTRPGFAEDVFVECFAGSQTEGEVSAEHRRAGGRSLRDDDWIDPHGGAGDGCGDWQRAGLGERADHGPDEGTLALRVVPRVEVIADPEALEASLLGHHRLLDQLGGSELLAGEEIAQTHGAPWVDIGVHARYPQQ